MREAVDFRDCVFDQCEFVDCKLVGPKVEIENARRLFPGAQF